MLAVSINSEHTPNLVISAAASERETTRREVKKSVARASWSFLALFSAIKSSGALLIEALKVSR